MPAPETKKQQDQHDYHKLEGEFKTQLDSLKTAVIAANDVVNNETKSIASDAMKAVEAIALKCTEMGDKLHEVQQKTADSAFASNDPVTLGEQFTKQAEWEEMQKSRGGTVRMETKTAIINATGQNQPLVEAQRNPGIIIEPNRILTIRDLCPIGKTNSNLIEFASENVFTNNAGPQVGGSPEAFENVTKPESGITFTLGTEAIQTLAHWIPVSKQVLSDSPMLQSFVNGRMQYGLKLEEEDQLLNGSGANGNLNGLITQATAWANESPNLTNKVDVVRNAIKQAHLSEYRPNAVVLNPVDWYEMEIKKVGSSDDRYVIGDPAFLGSPQLWGLQVVVTNSIAAGTFLLGSFAMGCQIWDREESSISVSTQNSDNFVKNMVTILAEERIALTVYRTAAFITGSFAGTA